MRASRSFKTDLRWLRHDPAEPFRAGVCLARGMYAVGCLCPPLDYTVALSCDLAPKKSMQNVGRLRSRKNARGQPYARSEDAHTAGCVMQKRTVSVWRTGGVLGPRGARAAAGPCGAQEDCGAGRACAKQRAPRRARDHLGRLARPVGTSCE